MPSQLALKKAADRLRATASAREQWAVLLADALARTGLKDCRDDGDVVECFAEYRRAVEHHKHETQIFLSIHREQETA